MDASKKAYKKLTNANGLIRVFSIISLILCILAVTLEPLGKLIYNMIFTNEIKYLLVNSFKSYVNMTQYSYIFLVMTLALMIAAFSSKRKKNIGQGFATLMMIVPIVACVNVAIDMFDYLDSSAFDYYMHSADNNKFRGIAVLMVYVLALASALLLVLCGLVLLIKAAGEKATEITYIPKPVKVVPQPSFAPQQGGFAQPQGMNNGFVAAPFAANNNAQSPFAPPAENAIPASAPIISEPMTQEPAVNKLPETEQQTQALPKTCSDCGATLADNAKFCKNCGKPV